jgi:hypothetical protein
MDHDDHHNDVNLHCPAHQPAEESGARSGREHLPHYLCPRQAAWVPSPLKHVAGQSALENSASRPRVSRLSGGRHCRRSRLTATVAGIAAKWDRRARGRAGSRAGWERAADRDWSRSRRQGHAEDSETRGRALRAPPPPRGGQAAPRCAGTRRGRSMGGLAKRLDRPDPLRP